MTRTLLFVNGIGNQFTMVDTEQVQAIHVGTAASVFGDVYFKNGQCLHLELPAVQIIAKQLGRLPEYPTHG